MLSDWERRQWAGIERELAGDRLLTKKLALPPSVRERRLLALRRAFFPAGYLASEVLYMLVAMDGAQLGLVVGSIGSAAAAGLLLGYRSARR
jgi:hypothetical protein